MDGVRATLLVELGGVDAEDPDFLIADEGECVAVVTFATMPSSRTGAGASTGIAVKAARDRVSNRAGIFFIAQRILGCRNALRAPPGVIHTYPQI